MYTDEVTSIKRDNKINLIHQLHFTLKKLTFILSFIYTHIYVCIYALSLVVDIKANKQKDF